MAKPLRLPADFQFITFKQTYAFVLTCLFLAAAPMGLASSRGLRTLLTAKEAHSLTMEEAAKGYPVKLRAVVTYFDPFIDPRGPAFLVHDASGGVFIGLTTTPAERIEPGMLVEVTGVSAGGDFAPIVGGGSVRLIGPSKLPEYALPVSMTQLLTGAYDGQWIEIEGVVHSVEDLGRNVILSVAMNDGTITATAVREDGADYAHLVDSRVKIHANAIPLFNRKRQMIGVHLLFPGLLGLKSETTQVVDPFALPVTPIADLLRYNPDIAFNHRVHVRGTVTLQWPGRSVCIQTGSSGLCAQATGTEVLREGQSVDVVGFPAGGGLTSTLTNAIFRPAGAGTAVTATLLSAQDILQGDHDAELVTLEGKLIGEDHGSNDRTLILSSGKLLFPVILPASTSETSLGVWRSGSTLRVTGICSARINPAEVQRNYSKAESFRLLVSSVSDITVVHAASWWTADHLLRLLAVVLAITLTALAWAIVLRHRVSSQATLIQNQNAILRDLSFQDGLTGVANRRKFAEALESEFRRAAESTRPLSLLMIDIDHFKLLNDAYGHLRGDECLVSVAKALDSAKLRSSDLVARYGGEEFAVILPDCDDNKAIEIGERMRTAVSKLAIPHCGSPFHARVSISVGAATIVPSRTASAASLVEMADSALYRSKLEGRNRTTCSSKEVGALVLASSTA